MIVNLRKVPQHLETLARWHQKEWDYLNPNGSLSKRMLEMQNHLNSDFIPTTFVALNNELCGSAAIIEHDMSTRTELGPWLASVYVSPQFRKKGIGTKLVRHATKQAKDQGLSKLYLFTPDQENFYYRLGWSFFEKTSYQNHNVTIMYVDLNMTTKQKSSEVSC